MAKMVNTVLGPVSSDALGKTYIHEHILFGTPGFHGDASLIRFDWDDTLQQCIDTVKHLMKNYGLQTMVDATPNECGRNVLFMKAIAEATGLNIIASSGYYYEGAEGTGAPAYFRQLQSMVGNVCPLIEEMFRTEVTKGIEGTGIKAGVFKLASGKGTITPYEENFFKAAAKVSTEEGIPIITHTQEGTMGPEQADLLIANGADPKRINIGHIEGNTDIAYYLKVLSKGVYISFDRFGIEGLVGCPSDFERRIIIAGLCAAGYADRIMISHDSIFKWLRRPIETPPEILRLLANWNWSHIFVNVIPALKKMGVSNEQIDLILIENPKRFFGY